MEPRKGDRRARPVIGLAGARSGAAGPLRRYAPLRILQTAVSQPQPRRLDETHAASPFNPGKGWAWS